MVNIATSKMSLPAAAVQAPPVQAESSVAAERGWHGLPAENLPKAEFLEPLMQAHQQGSEDLGPCHIHQASNFAAASASPAGKVASYSRPQASRRHPAGASRCDEGSSSRLGLSIHDRSMPEKATRNDLPG